MRRVAKPGAPILLVGPDVLKTIQRWKDGHEPWHMVLSTIEDQDRNFQPAREHETWDGAHHYWNCSHQRVWVLLEKLGFRDIEDYFDRIPKDTEGREWKTPQQESCGQ